MKEQACHGSESATAVPNSFIPKALLPQSIRAATRLLLTGVAVLGEVGAWLHAARVGGPSLSLGPWETADLVLVREALVVLAFFVVLFRFINNKEN